LPDRSPGGPPPAGPQGTGAEAVRGIALVALGYAIISCADAALKWAMPEVGIGLAMIARGVVGTLCIVLIFGLRGLWPRNRRLVAARSILHCFVSAAWYWAWANAMPLADSYAVAAVAPLLMTVLAIPMLGETVGWRRWTSTMVGFAGAMVMLQPGGDLWRIETPVLLAATAAMAVTRIWTRILGRTETPASIAFWLLAAHVPAGVLLLPAFPPPAALPGAGALLALVFFGIANAAAHYLFARAFILAPVGTLAPFEYTPLLWGGLLGFLIWAEVPGWTTVAGAAVVAGAGLYAGHPERLRRAAEGARAGAVG
jgi:drug/metabolite transporter (DMT)-like permease